MRPIQRKFVVPSKNVHRVGCAAPLARVSDAQSDVDLSDLFHEYEVREMDGRLGRIEWRDSIREYERAFEDTRPGQLEHGVVR